jgi:hypothetical protein
MREWLGLMFYRLAAMVDEFTFDKEWERHFIITGECLPPRSIASRFGLKLRTGLYAIGNWLGKANG